MKNNQLHNVFERSSSKNKRMWKDFTQSNCLTKLSRIKLSLATTYFFFKIISKKSVCGKHCFHVSLWNWQTVFFPFVCLIVQKKAWAATSRRTVRGIVRLSMVGLMSYAYSAWDQSHFRGMEDRIASNLRDKEQKDLAIALRHGERLLELEQRKPVWLVLFKPF